MSKELIQVYLMPGMAANPSIFEHIKLPENKFKIHWLEWIMPVKDEPLSNYALRMTQQIKEEDVVLLGVSFGGILVQEMSKHIKVKKLIVVSSVTSIIILMLVILTIVIHRKWNVVKWIIYKNFDKLLGDPDRKEDLENMEFDGFLSFW